MMFVLGSSTGESVEGGWLITSVALVFYVALPLVLLGFGLRSRRRSRREGAPGAAWAMALLIAVRIYLGYAVLVAVVVGVLSIAGHAPDGTARKIGDASWENGVVSIKADGDLFDMCPFGVPTQRTPEQSALTGCKIADLWTNSVRTRQANPALAETTFAFRVDRPRGKEKATFLAFSFASGFCLLLGLIATERILHQTTKRRPFAMANVVWLRLIAGCLAVHSWLLVLLGNHYVDRLLARYATAPDGEGLFLRRIGSESPNSLAPLGIAALILVLAEIWRFGIRLQDDVEATV